MQLFYYTSLNYSGTTKQGVGYSKRKQHKNYTRLENSKIEIKNKSTICKTKLEVSVVKIRSLLLKWLITLQFNGLVVRAITCAVVITLTALAANLELKTQTEN